MGYQALYRKYRPSSFDEVVGQKHIVRTLKNAIEKNRIAHAYLFCGPRGTGKTSIAKIFARTLNCTSDHPPCMECENCRLSIAGTHPDIIEIDAASNNGVEEVRSLIDRVGYSPLEGRYKVYIIDEVHMMTSGAFNALLKTIEEPPAHVIFIFATTEPHKVLPTILSRCQRYDFSQVSEPDIQARLKEICAREQIDADEPALNLIARLAQGGMRDALSILDQCIAYEQDHLSVEAVREIYGVVQPEEIGSLVSCLNPSQAEEAIRHLEQIENRGMDMKRFTADLIRMYKDSLLLEMAPDTGLISEEQKAVLRSSFLIHPSAVRIELLNDLMALYSKLAYSSNVMDYLETILLKSVLRVPAPASVGALEPVHPEYEKKRSVPILSEKKSETPVPAPPKTKKPLQVPVKSDLGALFWNYDVSRETPQNRQIEKSEFPFSEDFLLGLLVGASKAWKSTDQSALSGLSRYSNDLEYGKFAHSLRGMSLAASGETYLLGAVRTSMARDHINGLQESLGYEMFLKEVLGKPKKVFALTLEEARKLIERFKTRSAEHSLPPAVRIELAPEVLVQEMAVEDLLKERFEDLKIVDD